MSGAEILDHLLVHTFDHDPEVERFNEQVHCLAYFVDQARWWSKHILERSIEVTDLETQRRLDGMWSEVRQMVREQDEVIASIFAPRAEELRRGY